MTATVCSPSPLASSGRELSPDTFQTLPSQVLTMAVSPLSVKSKPVSRRRQDQGLSVGRLRTSTAKGPSFLAITASAVKTCAQREGPPLVLGVRSRAGMSITTWSAMVLALSRSWLLANQSVNIRSSLPAGMCKRRSPLLESQCMPSTCPSTPATVMPSSPSGRLLLEPSRTER